MNDYSMYPYIPTGAVSLSGPPPRLLDPFIDPVVPVALAMLGSMQTLKRAEIQLPTLSKTATSLPNLHNLPSRVETLNPDHSSTLVLRPNQELPASRPFLIMLHFMLSSLLVSHT